LSSILKALQRLQGDRGEGALPEPQPALGDELARELAQGPASRTEPTATLSRARLTLIGVGAAGALLATAGIGWWLARGPAAAPPLAESAAPPLAESAAPPLARSEAPPEPEPPSGTLRRARPARPSAAPEEAPTLPASVEPHAEAPAGMDAEKAEAPAQAPAARAAAAPASAAPAPAPLAEAPSARAAPAPEREEAPRIELVGEAPERAAASPVPGSPTAAPPVAAAPRAEPRAGLAPPTVEVLRTTWHPRPERRVARLRVVGFAAPVEVREGDAVSTLVVKTIEPSGVLFLHGGTELRRDIGKR
jgi:hypothetical protein